MTAQLSVSLCSYCRALSPGYSLACLGVSRAQACTFDAVQIAFTLALRRVSTSMEHT